MIYDDAIYVLNAQKDINKTAVKNVIEDGKQKLRKERDEGLKKCENF